MKQIRIFLALALLSVFVSCENPFVNNLMSGPDAHTPEANNKQSDDNRNAITYTVTFNKNHDDVALWRNALPATKQVVTPVTKIDMLPDPPTRQDFLFIGWNINEDGSGDPFNEAYTVDKNITVYAQWITLPANSQGAFVLFEKNNRDAGSTDAYPLIKITSPPDFTINGFPIEPLRPFYFFTGWNTNPDGSGLEFDITTKVTANIIAYAQWEPDLSVSFVVTFDENNTDAGSAAAQPNSIVAVPPITNVRFLPAPPTRPGHIFAGWNTAPDGSGNNFTASTVLIANITVYAQWLSVPTGSFIVIFDKNTSDPGSQDAYPFIKIAASGSTVDALPAIPARPGCLFAGWNSQPNGAGQPFTASTIVTKNITVYAQWFTHRGAGTSADPYKIFTPEDLTYIAERVNAGDANYNSRHYLLMNDIDLTEYGEGRDFNDGNGWIPIGSQTRVFSGTFDGGNNTVNNLYVNANQYELYVGLFGKINNGMVKNLGLENININSANYAGGIAGYVSGNIENCYTTGNIISDVAGGIAGIYESGTIYNSHSIGDIRGYSSAGGIAGVISEGSFIENSYTTGNISSSKNAGGITGEILSSIIINSYSSSIINADLSAGGITGVFNSGVIQNCYFTGNVSRSNFTGGIAGSVSGGVIRNSYSTGGISSSNYAGGIAGGLSGSSIIMNCYSTGGISSSNFSGGIAGRVSNGAITNCAALNQHISTEATAGRIIGELTSGSISNNLAFNGITNLNPFSQGLGTIENDINDKNGANIYKAAINADGTITGFFTSEGGWTTSNGRLPGLFGQTVAMPSYLEESEIGLAEQLPLIINNLGVFTYGDSASLSVTGGSAYAVTQGNVVYEVISGRDVISLSGNVITALKPGSATVIAYGEGDINYSPVFSEAFIVIAGKRNISRAQVGIDDYTYTGSAITPIPRVNDGSFITNDDYSLSYSQNINAGSGIVTITATDEGNYTGTRSIWFNIEQASPVITSLPVSTAVTYGSNLAASNLTGGSATFNGQNVPGTFTWANNTVLPVVSNSGYQVMFIPEDSENFYDVWRNVAITVNPKPITITSVSAPSRTIVPFGNITQFGTTAAVNITISGLVGSDTALIRTESRFGLSGSGNIGANGTLTINYDRYTSVTNSPVSLSLSASGNYTLASSASVTGINIIDGAVAARAVPVYQANINDFNAHANNTWMALTRHYKLMENVTLSGNWTSIGSSHTQRFTGSFDGQGYTISNMFINAPDDVNQGMFGYIGYNGLVKNLGLVNVNITGETNTGGIAGYMAHGTIQECYVTGSITGGNYTGGIAGFTTDSATTCFIINSYAVVNVTGAEYVGGITGGNIGSNINCYAAGTVTGRGFYVGGISGFSDGGLQNCVALNTSVRTSLNSSASAVHRIMGKEDGGASYNNYARHDMTMHHSWNGSTGTNRYASSGIYSNDGATVGEAHCNTSSWWTNANTWITNTHNGSTPWNFSTVWIWNSATRLPILRNAGGNQNHRADVNGTPLIVNITAPADILSPVDNPYTFTAAVSGFLNNTEANNAGLNITDIPGISFSGHNVTGNASNGIKTFTVTATLNDTHAFDSGSAIVNIVSLTNLTSGYVIADENRKSITISVADGRSSSTNSGVDRRIPVTQANISRFNTYANTTNGLGRHYKQTQNITLTVPSAGGSNWTTIGTRASSFSGSYNGQGYTISNLTINRPNDDYQGMFGSIDGSLTYSGANTISNLGLVGCNIRGQNYVGGLVGRSAGDNFPIQNTRIFMGSKVRACYVTGNINGNNYVGGISGYNNGVISNCYTTSSVMVAMEGGGGIAGINGGMVENCYATGNIISGGSRVGGIVGTLTGLSALYGGRTRNCVAINSNISGSRNIGRVVGYHEREHINFNYARTNMVTGTYASIPNLNGKDGANVSVPFTSSFWTTASNWTTSDIPAIYANAKVWDFTDIWQLNSNNMPILRNFSSAQNPTY